MKWMTLISSPPPPFYFRYLFICFLFALFCFIYLFLSLLESRDWTGRVGRNGWTWERDRFHRALLWFGGNHNYDEPARRVHFAFQILDRLGKRRVALHSGRLLLHKVLNSNRKLPTFGVERLAKVISLCELTGSGRMNLNSLCFQPVELHAVWTNEIVVLSVQYSAVDLRPLVALFVPEQQRQIPRRSWGGEARI